MEKEKQQNTGLDPVKIMLWVGAILLLTLPWMLTRSWGCFHFSDSTGVIGDTIGGITAPVSGFLGAYLVYRALKEQINANEIIATQFKEQKQDEAYKKSLLYITERLKMLREDIMNFEIVAHISNRESPEKQKQTNVVIHRGVEAIAFSLKMYAKGIEQHGNDIDLEINAHLIQVRYFLETIKYLMNEFIDQNKYKPTDRLNLRQIVIETYRSKLFPFLDKAKDLVAPICPTCHECHEGIPPSIYVLFSEINQQIESLKVSID